MDGNGFAGRSEREKRFAADVSQLFRERGILVADYSQERIFDQEFHRALMDCEGNPTAQFLRYKPDRALVVVARKSAALCEIKSGTGKDKDGRDYPDFTYEADSFIAAQLMAIAGVRTFVIFGDWTAAWVANLRPREVIIPEQRFSLQEYGQKAAAYRTQFPGLCVRRAPTRGSGTVMVKVPREQFTRIDCFLETELGACAGPTPTNPFAETALYL